MRRLTRRGVVIPLFAALLYVGFTVLFTYPAWRDPAHLTIGYPGDTYKFVGFLSWYPFALTHGLNPLHLSWMNLPTGSNAMWDTTMQIPSVIIWPITLLAGAIPAYNAVALLGLASDGFCTFLWLRRHVSAGPAFAGGMLVAFGPYSGARAYGHLNLFLFFAVPLMLMVVEDMLREPHRKRVWRGITLGALAAVQLFLTEEILLLAAIGIAAAAVITAVLSPRRIGEWARALAPAAGVALLAFVLIAGPALAYQFFGPLVPHKQLQPLDVYVNDLVNFIQPTSATAISPGGPRPDLYTVAWTGNWIEWNGYIGIPMLLLGLFAAVRWGRERWLLVVSLTTLAVAVLSLGPHLHVNGRVLHIPLPSIVFAHLPVVNNMAPARLGLVMDFGVAALLATCIHRALRVSGWPRRAAALLPSAVACASLFPAVGVPAASPPVPAYFAANGDVHRLTPGTVALVFPIPYVGTAESAVPAVWQAVSGFQFKLVSGAGNSVSPTKDPTFGAQIFPLRCVTDDLQLAGTATGCGPVDSTVRAQLSQLKVHVVIVGPETPNQDAVVRYFTSLLGVGPSFDQGVMLWTL